MEKELYISFVSPEIMEIVTKLSEERRRGMYVRPYLITVICPSLHSSGFFLSSFLMS
jgi:hypothetical protein